MPYAVDLFCGAGGCSEGLIQAGFHILFSSDISDMVEVTYKHRHEQLGLIQGKIPGLSVPIFGILLAMIFANILWH